MCLKVRDQFTCLHVGSWKGFEYCIWQMRARGVLGVEQTEMTLEQNLARCASASTDRYDYPDEPCPACNEKIEIEEKEYQEKLAKQEEFRAKQRSDSMRSDYDHRQYAALEWMDFDGTHTDAGQIMNAAIEKAAADMRESKEQ